MVLPPNNKRDGGSLPTRRKLPKPAAPPLLLAERWHADHNPAGWLMSEKLDGVRAYWTGSEFRSRQGNVFRAPDWFTADLPDVPLDGELWLDRKAFQRTVAIVRRLDQSEHWKQVRYLVFDAPAIDAPFEDRLACLRVTLHESGSQYASPLEHTHYRDKRHLHEELDRIEALGGEGVILRQPASRYEAGRSNTLLKLKSFHDAEAVVVEHVPGKGRHKGRLGALLVQMPDGVTFSVGTGFTDQQRQSPPLVGSTITYRYQELTDRGVPRFPSFVRVC